MRGIVVLALSEFHHLLALVTDSTRWKIFRGRLGTSVPELLPVTGRTQRISSETDGFG